MNKILLAVFSVIICLLMLAICMLVVSSAQDITPPRPPTGLETIEKPKVYEYEGYKHGTKLRGNWSGDKPPGSNDRLYEYDIKGKTGVYYEFNGYEWKEKGEPRNDTWGGDVYDCD